MKATPNLGYSPIASLLVIGLAACGGGSDTTAPPPPVGSGVPLASSPCTNDSYALYLSPYGPVTGDRRFMSSVLRCSRGGNPAVPSVADPVPIDWTVTDGGGSILGQSMIRFITDSEGSTNVIWDFGSSSSVQSIEARFNGVSPSVHASVSYTVLVPGPNRCEAAGGTDLGAGRTISSNETWTKTGSPYFTAGEVNVTNGAALTIEPGATICVNKIVAKDGSRLVASGTASEPIYFGVRSRADHWKGLELQAPALGATMSGPSVVTHTVIENATDVKALAHPIVVEDTLMRRVAPAARNEHCAVFSIQQHSLASIEPSRVLRTVIDGLGDNGAGDDYFACPSLSIPISDSFPLVVSARVINSRGHGVDLNPYAKVPTAGQTRLINCEISGSVYSGLRAYSAGPVHSVQLTSCNVAGNLGPGVVIFSEQLDARGNWWGDPAGPVGPKGDGVLGYVDAGNPLSAPVVLGY